MVMRGMALLEEGRRPARRCEPRTCVRTLPLALARSEGDSRELQSLGERPSCLLARCLRSHDTQAPRLECVPNSVQRTVDDSEARVALIGASSRTEHAKAGYCAPPEVLARAKQHGPPVCLRVAVDNGIPTCRPMAAG